MRILILILSVSMLSACSIFQSSDEQDKNAKNTPEEVYVFDEVSDSSKKDKDIDDLKNEVDNSMDKEKNKTEQPNQTSNYNINQQGSFYLQLGAFSTLNRAEQFIKENESKVPFKLSIVFNNLKGLYTVRSSAYKTKAEAEMIRDGFWKQNMFKDSFIVTE
jgi:hypothetical protein